MCGESIARIPEVWKRFLDPDSGRNWCIEAKIIKIRKCLIFASIHPPPSLNQGQGSVFTLRECAQSIFRIKLPLEKSFLQKFKKIFFCKKLLDIFVTKCKKIWFIAVNKIIFLCKKYSEGPWKYFFWILQYHFYNTEKNRIKNGFS